MSGARQIRPGLVHQPALQAFIGHGAKGKSVASRILSLSTEMLVGQLLKGGAKRLHVCLCVPGMHADADQGPGEAADLEPAG